MSDTDGASPPGHNRLVDVLDDNRNLLINNIVLCEEFYSLLKEYKVIPPVMVDEVKNAKNREVANTILLHHIRRLGHRTFSKFCDVLMASGHLFLAEHIKTEVEQNDATNRHDTYEDVFRRFPATLKVLSPGEQRALSNYIKEKVTDGIIKNSWKLRMTDGSKRIDDNIQKVTDIIYKDRRIHQNEAEISTLKQALDDERRSHKTTQQFLTELENRTHDLQVKYNEQLKIIMTSYDASERANMECDDRLGIFDRQIKAMNVRIQKYDGVEEYAAQADAANVKVSRLEENVYRILDTLAAAEQEVNDLHRKYDEERKQLFEALGLDDNGQDLRSAFINSQHKMNSEVKRLTAEVDLLSMAFELESVWSLFEKERQKLKPEPTRKDDGGKSSGKRGILKGSSRDFSDFDYSQVLQMIRKRLHEVHMEIEKLKRANLVQDRKIGRLQGELDMIRLRGQLDNPEQLDDTDSPRDERMGTKAISSKSEGSNRRAGVEKSWNNSTRLSPVSESYLNQDGRTSTKNTVPTLPFEKREPVTTDGQATPGRQENHLPPIGQSDHVTPRLEATASPRRQKRKKYPDLSMDRSKERRSLQFAEKDTNKNRLRHLDHEPNLKMLGEKELTKFDFQGVLSDSKANHR